MAVIEWTGARWVAPAGDAVWQPGARRTIDDPEQVAGYLALPGFRQVDAPTESVAGTTAPAEQDTATQTTTEEPSPAEAATTPEPVQDGGSE